MICFRILFGKAWSTHVKERKLLYIPRLQINDTFIFTKVVVSQRRILIMPLSPLPSLQGDMCCKRQSQAPQCRACFSLSCDCFLCQACFCSPTILILQQWQDAVASGAFACVDSIFSLSLFSHCPSFPCGQIVLTLCFPCTFYTLVIVHHCIKIMIRL